MENTKTFDVTIIGGGVTGTAILYVLSKFTNVNKIALIEKCPGIAQVQSSKNNNSQTLHFGDIETHYTPEKAKFVKEAAELVKNYVTKNGNHLYTKYHKMALAVGESEVKTLKERQKKFQKIFPDLRLIERDELLKVEPNVIIGRDPKTPLIAAFTPEGYAVNFGALSHSFVKESKNIKKSVEIILNSTVKNIKKENESYLIESTTGKIRSKVLIVAASANSLTFAHKLGYGKDLILLPVAGDFFCADNLLNGKVYMMQNPKLPFAAIHGDPDVSNSKETRFGPIAKVLPILEKRNIRSVWDFIKLFQFKWSGILSILNILSDPVYYRYVFWNILYEIPYFGKYFFVNEVKKIVPSIKAKQLHYGKHVGGIRPQVVDTKTKNVALGEAKLLGDNIIFNITPSPGASVCLKNAQIDVKKIIEFLGDRYSFNEKAFLKELGPK